jgi:hypothetical protein
MTLEESNIAGVAGDNNLYKKILQKGTLEPPVKSTIMDPNMKLLKKEMDLIEK